ncbi:T9SS type B sorting domain-containing protein, partial [Flavobacterium suaedae]|uniref:T9SS type B sorting domain-containing protein n=1 Tax=Flavobacterium suaedae TaxID=1767027 RepID=UPI001662A794
TTLTIKVLPLPTPETNPAPLVLCDDNNSPDGEEEFNLTDAEDDIRNNDNSTIITYHETPEDAEEGINPIANPEAYQSPSGTIYVRVAANTGNPNDQVCYQVVELELIVNPLPELGENGIIAPNAYCEQNTDGVHTFILNEHTPYILGEDVNPDDYTLTFYYDQAAYQAGTALPNQYTNESSPQTILVAVENNTTGCIATGEVTLYVEEAAIANPVTQEFFECDYDGDNDGVYTFDLTQVEDQVLGTQDPAQYSVTYYESEADATAGENPITDPSLYSNENNPGEQEIWVRVTNTATISGCYELTSFTLYVEPIPEPQLQGGTICVDYDTSEVLSPFVLDTGLDDTHTFVWYQDGVQIAGATESTYTVTQAGSYTVEAISANGCISDPIAPVTVERSGPASQQLSSYNVSGAFSEDQTITIITEGYGDYEYQLDYGPWQDSPIFTNVSPGLHQVHIRDKGACTDYIVTLEDVSIIDYPRYFTPNGDGYHDYWNIYGLNSQGDAEIYIFDRYGKLIKQISSQSQGWDGTFNGNPLPADDYWFSVTFNEYIIQLVPLTNPDGTPIVDPDSGEPVMGQVPTEVT